MSINCGHCKGRHDSVAAVRACGTDLLVSVAVTATAKKLPGLPAWAVKHIAKGTQRYQGPTVAALSIGTEQQRVTATGRIVLDNPPLQSFPAPRAAAPAVVEIPAGIYAIKDDEIKCYTVGYGKPGTRWEGFLFLERISSDDRYPIRNKDEKNRILDAIRLDVEASGRLAAKTLRQCRRCRRTLSDTKNPYFEMGMGPECGGK